MSALTLLSAIAPAVPNVPQGSSDEAASGFQTLLATLAGDETAPTGARSGSSVAPATDETAIEAPAVTGFLVAPTAPTVPLILPAAEEPAPGAGPDTSTGDKTDGPLVQPPVPAVAASEPDGPPTTPLLPVDKGPAPKTVEPEVQPAVPDRTRPTAPATETGLTLAETAAVTEAAEARVRTGAAPTPAPAPVAVPAPLRPLAERTARPLDAARAETGDSPRATDPVRPAGAAATAAPAVQSPAGPADFIAAVARDAAGSEAEGATPETLPSGETAAAQTQTSAPAREATVSQLSRAAVEATAQIAAQILRRLEGRSTRFEMALTPDEVGRVDVKLDIDSEGRLNARLAFDNPIAATDLRGRTDELRRQLEDAGFHLAEDAFEFAERDSGSSAFDRGQDARSGSSRAFAAATRLNTEIDVGQPPRWLALTLSPSGVDMKV